MSTEASSTSALENLLRPVPCPYGVPVGVLPGKCDYTGPIGSFAGAPSECPGCGRRVHVYFDGEKRALQRW